MDDINRGELYCGLYYSNRNINVGPISDRVKIALEDKELG